MHKNKAEKEKNTFLKTDENEIINESCIRWVKKMNECLEVCIKSDGCTSYNAFKVCKTNSLDSYEKLNKYFDKE